MVLSNLIRRPTPKLRKEQLVAVADLDLWLDVETDQFASNAKKLARQFAKAEVLLDLVGFRAGRRESAGSPDLPDIRDALYSADLRRIP